jgi:pilus assembly protein CpaD
LRAKDIIMFLKQDQKNKLNQKLMPNILSSALLLSSAVLAGCQTHYANVAQYDPKVLNYDERHPILLAEEEDALELYIGSGAVELTKGDRSALANYVRRYLAAGDSGMTVLVPAGAANESAARRILPDIRHVVRQEGVDIRTVAVTSYPVANPHANAPVRIVYNRVAAVTNPCGHWPDDIGGNFVDAIENKDFWNFGCASQQNLAAMLDDPRDIVRTRGMGKADASRRMQVLSQYREGSTTGAEQQSEGAVADVGAQ